jgi:hypothetical protein
MYESNLVPSCSSATVIPLTIRKRRSNGVPPDEPQWREIPFALRVDFGRTRAAPEENKALCAVPAAILIFRTGGGRRNAKPAPETLPAFFTSILPPDLSLR